MVADVIRTKRAVRQFESKPVPEDVIRQILDAGRRAQSSKNTQPWRFVVVREREALKRLSECGQYAGHLAGAAFAVALVSEKNDGSNDFDLGQAAAYLQLAAWELGVGSCIASMWEADRAKAVLGVPPERGFHTALSFGYPAQPPAPPRRAGRRSFDEVVRWERWSA
jgi:nitroreductase